MIHNVGDGDLFDLPRFTSIREVLDNLRLTSTSSSQHEIYVVYTKRTIDSGRNNPHFVVIKDKPTDTDFFTNYLCTCGCGIKCGVPCRHYWVAYVNTGRVAFHFGMVHDLWFKRAQPLNQDIELFIPDMSDKQCTFKLPHCRPMLSIVASSDEESHIAGKFLLQPGDHTNIRDRVSNLAVYGELLGAAKRAIQAIVDEGLPHDNLLCYLQDVAEERPCDNAMTIPNVVANPPIIRHKGRPRGSLGKRCRP
jgi:hypothetical protein